MGNNSITNRTNQEGLAAFILSSLMAIGALGYYEHSRTTASLSYALVKPLNEDISDRDGNNLDHLIDDDELCTASDMFTKIKGAKIDTSTFSAQANVLGGKLVAGLPKVTVTLNGEQEEIRSGRPEVTAVGKDVFSARQTGLPVKRNFVTAPRRVPFNLMEYMMVPGVPTEAEMKKKNDSREAKVSGTRKLGGDGISRYWSEFVTYKGKTREIEAYTSGDFFVELDNAGAAVACYGALSSRNFCVSSGGIFNSNAPAGTPKCKRT